jgi:DNA-binding HxlR family transcriptional regulator
VQYTLTRSGLAFEQVAAAIEGWGRQLLADALPSSGARSRAGR